MKVAMTKGWGICCNITLDPPCVFSFPIFLCACLFPSTQPLSYYSSPVTSATAADVILLYGPVPNRDALFSTTIAHSYCFLNLCQIRLSLETKCIRLRFPLHQLQMKVRVLTRLLWVSLFDICYREKHPHTACPLDLIKHALIRRSPNRLAV